MRCTSPIIVHGQQFNCGHCHACRINYTSQWTIRCLYELSQWKAASFITLTYDDMHLPKDYGLHPEDLRDFWKRLRFNIQNEYQEKKKIKYFACGEYGDSFGRPHYHAIVYGLDSYSELDRKILTQSWSLCDPYMFDKNRKHNGMLEVCREDIAYVCGYVQKKLSGSLAEEKYQGRQAPFSRCSQGLGLDFALANEERLKDNGFTYLGKQKIAIPRYLREKLDISQKELINSDLALKLDEKHLKAVSEQFEKDMKARGTWYPENLTMMSIRFERWYDDCQFALSRQIERDYLQRKKITSQRYI